MSGILCTCSLPVREYKCYTFSHLVSVARTQPTDIWVFVCASLLCERVCVSVCVCEGIPRQNHMILRICLILSITPVALLYLDWWKGEIAIEFKHGLEMHSIWKRRTFGGGDG